jgi:hypothetical protein
MYALNMNKTLAKRLLGQKERFPQTLLGWRIFQREWIMATYVHTIGKQRPGKPISATRKPRRLQF